MKTVIVLYTFVIVTFVASAEVYKWKNTNGMHFTDNPVSVPERIREKAYDETRRQIENPTSQPAGITKLNIPPVANQINQVAVYQTKLDQQRRVAEAMRQQQAISLAASTNNLDSACQTLTRTIAIWLMVVSVVFMIWVLAIVDIVRSEFDSRSNKTVWLLLVMFLPLLGMLFFYLF